jgi:hypothetical protein
MKPYPVSLKGPAALNYAMMIFCCGLVTNVYAQTAGGPGKNAATSGGGHNSFDADVPTVQGSVQGRCGGPNDVQCDEGYFCQSRPGACDTTTHIGRCTEIPVVCPLVFDPVCGCDGVTYDNACFAAEAEVSIDHVGPCIDNACDTDADCPSGPNPQFCEFPLGTCDGPGTCNTVPDVCGPVGDPVCGCDGVTYANHCAAQQAGMSVRYVGECIEIIELCTWFSACTDPEDFCLQPDGSCFFGFEFGTCVTPPDECEDDIQPVCGCDGVTYQNRCLAMLAEAQVSHEGPCTAGEPCGGDVGDTCLGTDVCIYPVGTCGDGDVIGECVQVSPICPLFFFPVCGCDGVTYGNACHATQQGVSVLHIGACDESEICGGFAGLECSNPDDFCLLPDGSCNIADEFGTCVTPPPACDDLFDPVCGCDGTTYLNRCHAINAGIQVDHAGACGELQICGGILGLQCDPGFYCQLPLGTCNIIPDLTGTCQPIPDLCAPVINPVCGCDGETYQNGCFAAAAGVSIDHVGPCNVVGDLCGGFTGQTCDEGSFCEFPIGVCPGGETPGLCQDIPIICPLIYAPVCGCDGVTYENACLAASAEISIAHNGECDGGPIELCGGFAGLECSNPDDFCLLPDGSCNVADEHGTCLTLPDECPENFQPVCGCDGVTYGNRCEANSAGVQVDHVGSCEGLGAECGGFTHLACEINYYCSIPTGDCSQSDAIGTCDIIPQVCPLFLFPVCGCDGNTYGNQCLAASVGVSLLHIGECGNPLESCFSDDDCSPIEDCVTMQGDCDGEGFCTILPQPLCTLEYAPVCGCDGVTYQNNCFAVNAGANIDHLGACEWETP